MLPNRINVSMVEKYRPNVAALLRNPSGKVLVAERIQNPGAWQFPQGGIDLGETALEALHREIGEELSLSPSAYGVIEQRDGYRYDFPEGVRPWKNVRGQEQSYFLCDFYGDGSEIVIETKHPEFSSWRWIEPREFDIAWVIDFKKEVYRRVLRDFFSI